MRVRNFLENTIDKHEKRITYKSISDATGVDASLISRYFLRSKELVFCDLLKVVRYLTPNEEASAMRLVMSDYLESPKPTNVRSLLLYFANSRMFDELAEFSDALPNKTKEMKAWCALLALFTLHKQNKIDGFKLKQMAVDIDVDTVEVRTLKYLLYAFGNMRIGQYTHFFDVTEEAERLVRGIKTEYIRECLMMSISEQFANGYLFQRADTRKARFYATTVQNNVTACAHTDANIEYVMGVSYMFENFSKSLLHLERCVKGLRLLGKNKRALLIEQDDIAFLYNYWQQERLLGSDQYDDSQKAYHHFQTGDELKARAIVERLEVTPFNTFLKGLIYGEEAFLVAACFEFRNEGNEFFAQLPLSAIKQEELKMILTTKIA